ncbi:MAG: LamG-like jellyroll fold domain-containing protein [Bacteroidota bacterium]
MNLQGKTIRKLTLSLLLLFWASVSFAANVESTGNGNWTNASTWVIAGTATNVVPTAADDVTILAGHAVTANTVINFQSLTIAVSGELLIGSTNFNGSTVTNNGTITWNNGALSGTTTITSASGGILNSIGNNTVANSGVNFVNQAGATFTRNGAGVNTINGTFENAGTLNILVTSAMTFTSPFTNDGAITNAGLMRLVNTEFISNTGSSINGGGTTTLVGIVTLSGSAPFEPGTNTVNSADSGGNREVTSVTNQSIVIPIGTTFDANGLTLTGLSVVTNNGTLSTGSTVIDVPVTNNGTMAFNNGNVSTNLVTPPTITNSGTGIINLLQSTNTIFDINFVNQAGGSITRNGTNALTITGDISNAGTLTVLVSKTLNLEGTITNDGDIIVTGDLNLNNADFVSNTGSTIDGGGTLFLRGTVTISGSAPFEPGSNNVTNADIGGARTLTSSTNHSMVIPSGTTYDANGQTISGLSGITNNGTFSLGTTNLDTDVTNNATMNFENGTVFTNLGTAPTVTNSGTGTINFNQNNGTVNDIAFVNQTGGNINRNGDNATTLTGPLSNAGTLTVIVSKTLSLEGPVTNDGDIVVPGTLNLINTEFISNTGSTIDGGGTLFLRGTVTISGSAPFEPGTNFVNNADVGGVRTLTSSTNQSMVIPSGTTYDANGHTISGLSGITNNGTFSLGTTILDTDVTNNATMNFENGTVSTSLGTAPTVTNSSTGTINFNQNNGTVNDIAFVNQTGGNINRGGDNATTLTGPLSNAGTLTVIVGKNLTLEGTVTNDGDIIVPGTLNLINTEFISNTGSTIDGGGTLFLRGTVTLSGSAPFEPGTNTVTNAAIGFVRTLTSSTNQSMIIPLGTTFNAAGLTISGLSGITNEGTFDLATTILDTDVTNNATMNFENGTVSTSLGTAPTVTNSATGALRFNQNNGTVSDIAFVNQAGGNVFRNGTNTATLTGSFLNESGATFTVSSTRTFTTTGTFTNNGSVVNGGNFNNTGILSGTGSFQGNITILQPGTLAPGSSPGTLNFSNNYTGNQANVVFSAEIEGTTPDTEHDQIIVGGTATIGGVLETSFDPAYGFTTNDVITLIDANTVVGTFASVTPALPADWNVRYDFPNTGEVSLEYTGPGTIGVGGNNNALAFLPGDYVDVANPADFNVGANTDFTIQAEIRTTFNTTAIKRPIFSKMVDNNDPIGPVTGYQLWAFQGKLTFEWFENNNGPFNIQSTSIISDNQCHHVAVTVDRANQTARLYVDGVLETTVTDARYGLDIDNPAPVFIGQDRTEDFFWYGELDEVAFFTEVRSDAQIISSLTTELNPVTEANLVGYWKFNEGVDGADNTGVTTAPDAAGGDNNGTLINFDLTGTEIVTNAPNGVPASSSVVTGTWVADPCGAIATPTTDLQFIVGNEVGSPGQTVTVPITVKNFNTIVSYQGSIVFDPAVLTFVSATSTLTGTTLGDPGTGSIPANTVTFGYFDPTFAGQTLADGTVVVELTFTVAGGASTGITPISINGSTTPLGYTNDIAATTLTDASVINGGVEVDADPIVINTVSIVSDNANNTALAKAGDVITLTFNLSEIPFVTPVVTIAEGGPGAVTVTGAGTNYTATKTVATGGDGLVTFSITAEDEGGNQAVATATTDASSVTVDTQLPTIACPADLTPGNDLGDCSADVTWNVPTGADNRPNFTVAQTAGPAPGSTFNVSATATTITYTVTDEAGNEASCSFTVQVSDTEAPVVNTQDITVQLDASGNATITAAQIEDGSTDNCAVDPGGFSLDKTAFTCADLGTVTVTLTVTDVNNVTNTGTATVTVEEAFSAEISGQAVTEPAVAPTDPAPVTIPNVDFDVNTTNPATQSSAAGTYAIDLSFCVTEGAAADIGVTKVDATNNGINIQDAVAVVRHVIATAPFNSPYKRIAADVNVSGSLNIIDALQIARKVVLVIPSFTTQGTPGDWTFIPSDFVFADPDNPWTFDTRRNFATLPGGDLSGQDFIGVKYGDVDNTFNNSPARPAPGRSLKFVVDQAAAQPGDLISIPVSVKDFNDIAGYQYTLQWDPNVLQFEAIEDKALEAIYGTQDAANGNLTAAWFDLAGQSVSLNDGEVAFEMTFRVVGQMGSQTSFNITSALTPSQAYEGDLTLIEVTTEPNVLTVGATTSVDPQLAGYSFVQNFPNPFTSSTAFEFSLGQSENVKFEIYSLTGQVVRSFEGRYTAGDHSLEWDGKTLNGVDVSEGVYLVRMTAGEFSSSIRVQKL